jgi:hypothetical protein
MTLPVLLDPPTVCRVPVRANWSRWISDCANPACRNGWRVDMSVVLWMCRDCWTVTRPIWPADPGAIAWLLSQRPEAKTRNWEPGESLTDLLMENAAHGIVPEGITPGTDDVLTEIEGRVVSGAVLPAIERARELLGETLALTEGE